MGSFSAKKLLLLGILAVIAAAIPLTMFLVRRQSTSNVGATAATTISFDPATSSATPGQPITLNIMVNPGNTNQVSFVKLRVTFDNTIFQVAQTDIVPANALPSVLEEATVIKGTGAQSIASITLSAGADPTKIITQPTKIAAITFHTISPLPAGAPATTQIGFDQANMQVLSAGADATSSENVLSSSTPETVTLSSGTPTPTTIVNVGTATPTATTAPPAAPGINQPPVCTTLGLDRAATGTAPYAITFTASGTDPDNAISKVSFNFGDGSIQDVTSGGNLGTQSISVQAAHTYVNPGTYSATTTLTDTNGAISASGTCTQTITVTAAASSGSGTVPIVTIAQNPATIPPANQNPTAAPQPKQPVSGPGETLVTVGAIGAVLSVIGAALFFAL